MSFEIQNTKPTKLAKISWWPDVARRNEFRDVLIYV